MLVLKGRVCKSALPSPVFISFYCLMAWRKIMNRRGNHCASTPNKGRVKNATKSAPCFPVFKMVHFIRELPCVYQLICKRCDGTKINDSVSTPPQGTFLRHAGNIDIKLIKWNEMNEWDQIIYCDPKMEDTSQWKHENESPTLSSAVWLKWNVIDICLIIPARMINV